MTENTDIKKRARARLGLLFLAIGLSGGLWVTWSWDIFTPNAPDQDVFLVVSYTLIYGLVLGGVAWALWCGLANRVLHISDTPDRLGRGFTPHLCAMVPVLILLGVGFERYQENSVHLGVETLPTKRAWGPSPYRVQIVGIDGADLRLIQALVEEGALPNFESVIRDGVYGPMQTISPHSPVVWTSIASGQPASKTGIYRYTTTYLRGTGVAIPTSRRDPLGEAFFLATDLRREGPVSSNERRVRAMWEILGQFGLPSLVVNWWATYPAEPIQGEMISNNLVPWSGFQRERLEQHGNMTGLTYPPFLAGPLLSRLNEYIVAHDLEGVKANAFSIAGYQYFKARDELAFECYQNRIADHEHDFKLMSVYLQGIDTASHAFSNSVYGENVNRKRPSKLPADVLQVLWNELVREAYVSMDDRVGILLEQMESDDILILVSDHGWEYDGTSHWNLPPGIFMAVGGPFLRGQAIRAHVYDIMPTLAHVLGLPISEELPGKILREAINPAWMASHSPASVPSYGMRGVRGKVDPHTTDPSHLEKLRSLGYIE